MAVAVESVTPSRKSDWLGENLPKLVLAPTFVITLFFVYGFILWTTFLSFTKSRFMPVMDWDGLRAYQRLWANSNWWTALENLFIFGVLYIGLATVIGLLLAILLDQKIRGEGVLRTIYLYPMALSFIVTGTAWKWLLNPGIGIEKIVRDWGFTSFTLDWIVQPNTAIYCIVIAAIWQSSGFVMAMFLAGLRGVDGEIIKAAQASGEPIDAITAKFARIYLEDTAALNVLPPDIQPRATEHVGDMIAMIKTLETKGHAYKNSSGVNFHVPSMANYGKLAQRDRDTRGHGGGQPDLQQPAERDLPEDVAQPRERELEADGEEHQAKHHDQADPGEDDLHDFRSRATEDPLVDQEDHVPAVQNRDR